MDSIKILNNRQPIKVFGFGKQGMAQWWECSPPSNVARVQIPASTPYVGWVCCWFSPLLREVFLRVLRFSPLLKNQKLHELKIPIRLEIRPDEEPLCGCATSKLLVIYSFIYYFKIWPSPIKIGKINRQSSKLPPHWDPLFCEELKGSFGRGVPPRRAFKPWPRLKAKIVHSATLFKEKRPYCMILIRSFSCIHKRNIFQNNIIKLVVLE